MEAASDEISFDLQYERFKTTSEAERRKILEERNNEKTNQTTKNMVKILQEYLMVKNLSELDEITDADLPQILKTFYTELRQKDGSVYKLASLKCIRAGLNRHFKETLSIDIISDPCFTRSNQMFKGVAKVCRKKGVASTRSFPIIPDEDMEKFGEHFYQDFKNGPVNAKKLQQTILFCLIYFTCRCSWENLHEMTPQTFHILTDANGKKFVTQNIDELDKNHQADSTEIANKAKMFETPGKSLKNVFTISKIHLDLNAVGTVKMANISH